jgi:hypothetical protein
MIGTVARCCECGYEPSGSCTTDLVIIPVYLRFLNWSSFINVNSDGVRNEYFKLGRMSDYVLF